MNETYVEQIIREVAEKHGLTPADLLQAKRKYSVTIIRDEAIKRIRAETQLTLPTIGKMFGISASSAWDALRSEKRKQIPNAEEKIVELWPDHDLHEIAAVVGMSAEGVRSVGRRKGLGRPFRHKENPYGGHRPFTEKCREILHRHGVML